MKHEILSFDLKPDHRTCPYFSVLKRVAEGYCRVLMRLLGKLSTSSALTSTNAG